MPAGQLEGDVTSHAVAHHDRLDDAELVTQPRQIVGEPGHRVLLHRLIAGAMATQIDRNDTMGPTEVVELRRQVRMVPIPAVHQQQRRSAAPGFRIRERDTITPKSLHQAPPPDPVSGWRAYYSHEPRTAALQAGPEASKVPPFNAHAINCASTGRDNTSVHVGTAVLVY